MTGERCEGLPSGWVWTTLGAVLTLLRGVSYKKQDAKTAAQPGFVPILRATNISGRLSFEDLVYVPEHYVSDEQLLRLGDIVVAASSGSRAVVGKAAPVTSQWHGSFGAFCFGLRPDERVHARYLAAFLQTESYRRRVSQLSAGVNINNLRREHIEDTPIPLAPLPEQHRIVAEIEKHFTRLDAAVAALERVRANLKRYRTAVLKAACEGRLVPTEAELARAEGRDYEPADQFLRRILEERRAKWEEAELAKLRAAGKPPKGDTWKAKYKEPEAPGTRDLPELPEGWVWTSVEQVVARSEYGTSVKCEYGAPFAPVLRIPNIAAGKIDLSDVKFSTKPLNLNQDAALQPGDILMCRTNGSVSLIGKVAVIRAPLCPLHTFASYLLRFRLVETSFFPLWIAAYLASQGGRAFIETNAASSAGQHNVSLTLIHGMPVPLPPFAEQERIVAEVERRLSVVEEIEAQVAANLQRAERLRQAILARAFAGKLVPQDPNDEPASVLLERIRAERAAQGSKANSRRGRGKAGGKRNVPTARTLPLFDGQQ